MNLQLDFEDHVHILFPMADYVGEPMCVKSILNERHFL